MAIAAIGSIQSTIEDRSFIVRMSRKTSGNQRTERFDRRAKQATQQLAPRLARWAQDSVPSLAQANPSLPDSLNDRQRDISEPLLAIADLAGGRWPALARDSLKVVFDASDRDDGDLREQLLKSVWAIFTATGEDFMTLKELVSRITFSLGYASFTTPVAESSSLAQVMMICPSVSTSNSGMAESPHALKAGVTGGRQRRPKKGRQTCAGGPDQNVMRAALPVNAQSRGRSRAASLTRGGRGWTKSEAAAAPPSELFLPSAIVAWAAVLGYTTSLRHGVL